MSSFLVNPAVLAEVCAAYWTHQNRRHPHLACLADIGPQVFLVGCVGLCAAHVSECIFAFSTQFGVLNIHIFSLAFLVVVSELNNEVVAGVHLALDGRPEVVRLVERTGGGTGFPAVVDRHGVRVEERLEVHAPAAFWSRSGFVIAHGAVADRVNFTRSGSKRQSHQG